MNRYLLDTNVVSELRKPRPHGGVVAWLNHQEEDELFLSASFQILPMDTPCFREWGRIMDRKPDRLLEDAMIAATARVHQLVVATRNETDFRQLDVRILNPFKTS
jgi:toxin FitB